MNDVAQRVDVGILTFREDELAAVLERFPPERVVDGRRMYNISRVPLEGVESYSVAIVRCLEEMGSGDAAQAVRDLVEDVAPRLLMLVGIASGMPSPDVTLGDVVVASRIINGSPQRENGVVVGLPRSTSEPLHKEVAKWVANMPAHALAMGNWSNESSIGRLPRNQSNDLKAIAASSRVSRAVVGVVVATDEPTVDPYLRMLLVRDQPSALAVEASSLDVYAAARTYNLPTMSVRGISDIVGQRRSESWTSYACKAAAAFALAFLKTSPLVPHPPAGHHQSTIDLRPNRPIDLANIFGISKVTLSNVRGFRELALSLNTPARHEQGQWTLLLGDNGVGKTTILRSLALALAPADVVPVVLGRAGPLSPTVRAGTDTATIRVGMPGEDQVTLLQIEPTKGGERLKRRVVAEVSMPFLVAYGSRRGSGLAGSARGAELTSMAAVETLFDEGANLIQPDVWLMGWQLAALQNPESQDARFFAAILATLCALLPGVQHVHVSREAVEVEGPTLGRVPLGALSDGYRTTMGWILDMVARWVEEAKRKNLPVDKDFHEQMTGVALIDEIDLHLHPRWQRDVVSMVRGHFPRMSFVVTTHNPLTLLGAQPGEIHVLRRTEQGDVEIVQRDLPLATGSGWPRRSTTRRWTCSPSTSG